MSSLGTCHSTVTKVRGTVEARSGPIGFFDELNPVLDQKIVGRDILVGKDADKIAIAVARIDGVVAHPIGKDLIGRILDSELLLQGVAAAEMDPSAAQDAAATDVVILIDDDHGGSVIACRDGGGQPRDPGSDHDHVRRKVPFDLIRVSWALDSDPPTPAKVTAAPTPDRAPGEESSPAGELGRTVNGITIRRVPAHLSSRIFLVLVSQS